MAMIVTLENGSQVELLGPERIIRADGSIFESHITCYIRKNGVIYTVSMDVFRNATFPPEAEKAAAKIIADSLPDVLDAFDRLTALDEEK